MKIRKNFNRNKHIFIVPIYSIFYLTLFTLLEAREGDRFHILYSKVDSSIPFCEYFIVPYLLWFFYVAAAVLYFMFLNRNKSDYFCLISNLGIGMTLFLLISLIYPNGHVLRPIYIARDNVFTRMVEYLYSIDTPTNIFPSIHVYNSVAVHMAITNCKKLKNHKWLVHGSLLLSFSIILATVFLKQHSMIDVVGALILNFICYLIIYRPKFTLQRAAQLSGEQEKG